MTGRGGVPDDLEFKTKPQLVIEMLDELTAEGFCPPWVTGDEIYGRDAKLRARCEAHSTGYVLKIPYSFRITLPAARRCAPITPPGWSQAPPTA